MILNLASKKTALSIALASGLFCAMFTGLAPAARGDVSAREDIIKAGFVLKFPIFVSWPEQSWQAGSERVLVTLLGESRLEPHLRALALQTAAAGRPVDIRTIPRLGRLLNTHILVIGESQKGQLAEVCEKLSTQPVLTIAEDLAYGRDGAMFSFYLEDGRVRFAVSRSRVERAGLGLSYRLNKIAHFLDEPQP